MVEKEEIKYLEGKGITELLSVPDKQSLERNKDLEYYKDIFYQCGKCGTCRSAYQEEYWAKVCPSGEFGKFEAYYLGGKNLLLWALTSGQLKWTENLTKIFFHCTVCLACVQQCQIPEIHHYAGEWLMAMREEAVKKGLGPMPEQMVYSDCISREHNPYMERHADRTNWFPSSVAMFPNAETLYFVGCTASYRENSVAVATAEILDLLKIQFKILKDERCCGSPVYMTGQTDRAKKIAETNVQMFKDTGVEQIITSCAGCYRAIKEIYPNKFGLDHGIEVIHLPELILDKLNSGELELTKEIKMKITYHDPCHLGRHMGIYETPRDVLKKIPGIELVEMVRNRHNAWCCGSGGGVRSEFKDLSAFAADERIKEAKEAQAEAIVSSCPFCLNQFKSNIKEYELQAFDISELVKNAI